MGTALARAQIRAGASITIWNRSADRASVKELVSLGATFEPSLEKAVNASAIIIPCVLNYSMLSQLLEPVTNFQGKTMINLTNGTPKDAREMKDKLLARGLSKYVDGGIMAGPDMIGTSQSFVLYSGVNEPAFEELRPVLEVFGRADYRGEDAGAAALLDLSLLAGMYGMFAGVLVSISLMRRQRPLAKGTIESDVKDLLNPFLQAFTASHERIAHAIENSDFDAHGHPMEMQSIAMQNVGRACHEEGVNSTVLEHFFSLVRRRVENGGGQQGLAAVMQEFLQ